MPLTRIEHLKQSQETLKPYIDTIQQLGDIYLEFIKQDNNGYQFDVHAGAESEREPGVHASECSGCMRRLVYGVMGTDRRPDPKNIDSNMKMRFRIGHLVHAQLQDELSRMGEWMKSQPYGFWVRYTPEVKLRPDLQDISAEFNIHSSSDGVIEFMQENETEPFMRIGHEIKTSSALEFDKLKEPKPEHIEQSHVYMAALDLPLMWAHYYNKSNSNFTKPFSPYLFRFNHAIWQKLEYRFVKAEDMSNKGQLPDREEGTQCKWCPFSYTCAPQILNRNSRPATISQGLKRRQR